MSTRLLALGASAAMLLAACGGGASTAPTTAPTTAASTEASAPASTGPTATAGVDYSKFTACVAFDTGGLGDKGFNDLAMKGLNDAKALGFKTAFSEAKDTTDYAANIQRLLDQGCQAIITVGFGQAQATADAAAANATVAFSQVDTAWNLCGPDFVCGNADDTPHPANFTGLDYQIDQAAMLAGYLAAGMSKTGNIGTYGGLAFPGVTRFMDGMYAGIKYYNEKNTKTVKLFGWDGNKDGTFVGGDGSSATWNNPTIGEQFAKTFIDQGVDVVMPVAGGTGNGTIKAMFAAGKWALGVDTDQFVSLGENPYHAAIISSAQKAIDVSVLDTFKANFGGNLGGTDYSGTLANNGVLLAPFHDFDATIPAALKADITALSSAIAGGTIKVCTYLARGC